MWIKDSFDEYLSQESVSASGLKEFKKSPAHFQAYLKAVKKSARHQEIGTLVHAAILENKQDFFVLADPEELVKSRTDKEYTNYKATKIWIEYVDEMKCEHAGKIPVTREEATIIEEMTSAVQSHTHAGLMFFVGVAEQSGYMIDKGIPLKIRPDFREGNRVIDLKTIDDIDNAKRQIFQYDYLMQAALYTKVTAELTGCAQKEVSFTWVFVEKKAPFSVRVIEASKGIVQEKIKEVESILKDLSTCFFTGDWPKMDTIETLEREDA